MAWIVALMITGAAFAALDAVWLRWAADRFYRPVIGAIMTDSFRAAPAIVFYLIYISGVVWFAVHPGLDAGSVHLAVFNGALLGALCYATFDFTCQAVMKVWSWRISIVDIAWGSFATATAAGLGTAGTLHLAG